MRKKAPDDSVIQKPLANRIAMVSLATSKARWMGLRPLTITGQEIELGLVVASQNTNVQF
jgi:hypothetical protein